MIAFWPNIGKRKQTTVVYDGVGVRTGWGKSKSGCAEDLHLQGAFAGAVELSQNYSLEGSKDQLAVLHRESQIVAQEHGSQVSVSIEAVAVAELGVVVLPISTLDDYLLEKSSNVVEQRLLEFIDKKGQGRMQRGHQGDSMVDSGLAHLRGQPRSDVNQLHALLGGDSQRLCVYLEGARVLAHTALSGRQRLFAHCVSVHSW